MGMSVSVATAIIFIAAIISAGSVIGTLDHAQASLMEAQRTSSDREMTALQTDIAISTIDRENGTVEVVNRGRSTLHVDGIDVLLDGRWSNELIATIEVVGHADSRIWLPGDTLAIQFTSGLMGTDIKIVTGNGISVYD